MARSSTSPTDGIDATHERLVLNNDLRADARLALRLILSARGVLPAQPARSIPVQVVTPYNRPA